MHNALCMSTGTLPNIIHALRATWWTLPGLQSHGSHSLHNPGASLIGQDIAQCKPGSFTHPMHTA